MLRPEIEIGAEGRWAIPNVIDPAIYLHWSRFCFPPKIFKDFPEEFGIHSTAMYRATRGGF